jgi:hypothetical protein
MSTDADHEVIDSPEALFRHLYEEHGLEEARDLDPETAPLQFWLRRHTDLERAERAARRQPDPPPEPPAAPSQPPSEPPAPPSRPRSEARAETRAQPSPPPGPGRRRAVFGDPLVEAMARTLAGRGHGEAAVRSAMRSFAAPDDGPTGEAAVRAVFVEPMLQAVAERLLGAPPARPAGRAQPSQPAAARGSRPVDPAPAPPQSPPARPPADPDRPPAREEPVRPEAAWAVLWADLADSGRRAAEGAGQGDDGDDLMAVANAVQARRRVRVLRR